MPKDGDAVTVRALWPMPGAADGSVVAVQWGPHLAALVDAGRYELRPAGPGPAALDGDAGPVDAPAGDTDTEAGATADGDRPARRPRGR